MKTTACLCKNISVLSLIALSAQFDGGAASLDVLVGPVKNPSNGHNYYRLTAGTWQDSEAKAREMKGHLATVRNQAENDWITTEFGRYDSVARRLWIGRTNSVQNAPQGWMTLNGESVIFTNWALGEPNNSGSEEHYAELFGAAGLHSNGGAGQWNDLGNVPSFPVFGIVEVPPVPPVIAGPILNPSNSHTYYLLADSSWTAAEAQAVKLGGHLATVNDPAENAWIARTFSDHGNVASALWIGLTDVGHEGRFAWVNDEPVTFSNWHADEPSNFGGMENYVLILAEESRQWNDRTAYPSDEKVMIRGVVEVPGSLDLPEISGYHAIEIVWRSQTGKEYQIQSRLGTEAKWTNEGDPIHATGEIMSLFERAIRPIEFYRVVPLN